MSIDGWVDKENVVYTYMEYYSTLKWGKSCLCDNTDEPGKHYAKWKKLGTEGKILYELMCIK